MTTHYLSAEEAAAGKKWYIIDAKGQTLGRLAVEAATLLRGKHKACFTPNQDCGDFVVVINAKDIKLTGNKLKDKRYYEYTGYIGGLKTRSVPELLASKPDQVIRYAVEGMLPNGKLGRKIAGNLKIYGGETHPHSAQKPELYQSK